MIKSSTIYLLLQMLAVIVLSFLYASGKAFPASFFIFSLLLLFLLRHPKVKYKGMNSGLLLVMISFFFSQSLSFSNYLHQEINFRTLFYGGCGNYLEFFLFSITWFTCFTFFYLYSLTNKLNSRLMLYFALLYFFLGVLHNIHTNLLMNNVHNLSLRQYNSPYYLFLPLPIIILFSKNNLTLKYILLFIGLIASIFAFKRSCILMVLLLLTVNFLLDFKLKNFFRYIFIGGLIIGSASLFPSSFGEKIDRTIERMEMIGDDGGSGRSDNAVSVLEDFERWDWVNQLLGSGFIGHWAKYGRNIDVEWFSILYYYGYLGLILYILFHCILIMRVLKTYKHNKSPLFYSYLSCYLIFFLYSFSGEMFTYQNYSVVLFMFLGIAESYYIRKQYYA